MTTASRELERSLASDWGIVAGMDEVGRGALAGPVAVGVALIGVHADQGDADGNGAGQRAAPNLVHASNNAPVRGKRALKLARRGGHEGLGTEEKTSGCPTFVLQ